MTDDEAERREAEAAREHLRIEQREADNYRDEIESLPIVLVGGIPLLVFGSLLLSVLGLKSHLWWKAMMALPVLGWFLYPYVLRYRMKTPLRLEGGRLLTGRSKRNMLISAAALGLLALILELTWPMVRPHW